MADPLYGTEYMACELKFTRGDSSDVVSVGYYLDVNPNADVDEGSFVAPMGAIVDLVEPPNPLAEGTKIDILGLIGSRGTSDIDPASGDYQVFAMVTTANEAIIRKAGILEVI